MSFICEVCGYDCDSEDIFTEHIRRHVHGTAKWINGELVHFTSFSCQICGKTYKRKSSYQNHVRQNHNTPSSST